MNTSAFLYTIHANIPGTNRQAKLIFLEKTYFLKRLESGKKNENKTPKKIEEQWSTKTTTPKQMGNSQNWARCPRKTDKNDKKSQKWGKHRKFFENEHASGALRASPSTTHTNSQA